MFSKVFAFLALVAVAFAIPKPEPQLVGYSSPGLVSAVGYSGYGPVAYSAPYAAAPYAAAASLPYGYSGYYVR